MPSPSCVCQSQRKHRGERHSQLGLAWRKEANALATPAQLQREGAHCPPKLGTQGDSEWGLSTNRLGSSISYKMAENINIDSSRSVVHNPKLYSHVSSAQPVHSLASLGGTDGRTDRQTDRETGRQSALSLLRY